MERDTPGVNRSRGPAFSEGEGVRGEAFVHRPSFAGSSTRFAGGAKVSRSSGRADREWAAGLAVEFGTCHSIGVAAGKGNHRMDLVACLRQLGARPHVPTQSRGTALDSQAICHGGSRMSQRVRQTRGFRGR